MVVSSQVGGEFNTLTGASICGDRLDCGEFVTDDADTAVSFAGQSGNAMSIELSRLHNG